MGVQYSQDLRSMRSALRLAAKGRGTTSPNPMVGAIIVNRGRVVGQGYHLRAGLPHAEALALKRAGRRARGATLYITLEPCCHLMKRTPPCVPAIVRSGVRRVVIAQPDPNPLVNGRGASALRRAGISVTLGVARREAEALNQAYRHWVRSKRPYVILKAGMTLDGQIATSSGKAKWITSKPSRREAHQLRAEVDGVLVGIGTVLSDDPSLTARVGPQLTRLATKQPLRVVVDTRLRTPLHAKILRNVDEARTLIATTEAAPTARRRALQRRGVEIVTLPALHGRVSLPALMRELGKRGITTLLVEGGAEINAAMLKARLVQQVRLYIAPTLMGGVNAKGMIGGRSPQGLAATLKLKHVRTRLLGGDLVVEGDL
ncbi:MAG TPA: bifunctional diaminohydroxyphosphoribosylaminopyrimidine deaminase/5-amino-6-(5-phosphoribosylamino)uracil reductase RibD [Nitrospira sp.]|jgi:diaminohydroxyphosphoribosylaminopyrimidine deaminase / 5-amino-6-(5-phosphoribosylamino)uracil reductase|nr:bifunctional diaminohydroxyphosphoribosylaminopyrimidine deaminase/5-amino-6-(5-phosphoribosylamino)uracil reductase RibD [Nitrospira sp.]